MPRARDGARDRSRVALAGFSDGASYALSLGIPNGNLFHCIIAFSPGCFRFPSRMGSPRIFVSHGTGDTVLPIAHCSRVLVPQLRRKGYAVQYNEFAGPHVVPPDQVQLACAWMHADSAQPQCHSDLR